MEPENIDVIEGISGGLCIKTAKRENISKPRKNLSIQKNVPRFGELGEAGVTMQLPGRLPRRERSN